MTLIKNKINWCVCNTKNNFVRRWLFPIHNILLFIAHKYSLSGMSQFCSSLLLQTSNNLFYSSPVKNKHFLNNAHFLRAQNWMYTEQFDNLMLSICLPGYPGQIFISESFITTLSLYSAMSIYGFHIVHIIAFYKEREAPVFSCLNSGKLRKLRKTYAEFSHR